MISTPFQLTMSHYSTNIIRANIPTGGIAVVVVVIFATVFLIDLPSSVNATGVEIAKRKLLQVRREDSETRSDLNVTAIEHSPQQSDPLFPPDAFTYEELQQGWIVLYIIGIIYMFYALALVCDEFFVPSLDVITEKLAISPDVAGATFMAAGGSAPELFTSIIGVFIAKNDVGIGTIVGSAVFNILFVIAACAFAAKTALSLTAWPLIRDVFFYSISLLLLAAFFRDNAITWWEALILLLWYLAYVCFMKFNEIVEDKLRSCIGLPEQNREGLERGVTLRNAHYRKGLFHLMNETINPSILRKSQAFEGEEMRPLHTYLNKEIMIGEPAGSKTGISGLKNSLRGSIENEAATSASGDADNASKDAGDNTTNGQWSGNNSVNPVQDDNWTVKTVVNESNKTIEAADDDDESEPIDMSFPKDGGWKSILVYLVSFPIMFPLWLTLPDTKDKNKRKYFVITFLGCILWIALFSYLMVWWATVTGNVIGIPPPVMGFTFLAAGTSVPDLVTSVLVAKQGKGDMAVSSSVGSNIFDVTVGLPLPWLLYCMVKIGESVTVNSAGVGCSVALLFLMLLCVFLSIVIFRWKMTKLMGIVMILLYAVFVVVNLGISYGWYDCII